MHVPSVGKKSMPIQSVLPLLLTCQCFPACNYFGSQILLAFQLHTPPPHFLLCLFYLKNGQISMQMAFWSHFFSPIYLSHVEQHILFSFHLVFFSYFGFSVLPLYCIIDINTVWGYFFPPHFFSTEKNKCMDEGCVKTRKRKKQVAVDPQGLKKEVYW